MYEEEQQKAVASNKKFDKPLPAITEDNNSLEFLFSIPPEDINGAILSLPSQLLEFQEEDWTKSYWTDNKQKTNEDQRNVRYKNKLDELKARL